MNGISKLSFGTQIVPIKSEKPISPQEQADLVKVKALLDEKMGKDIVSFKIKDANNIDVVINHPDPKVEKELAEKMKEMSGSINAKATAQAPKAEQPVGKKLNAVV